MTVGKDDVTLHEAVPADDRSAGTLRFECRTERGLLELRRSCVLQNGDLEGADWWLGGRELSGLDEYPIPDLRRKDWSSKDLVRERVAEAVGEWLPNLDELLEFAGGGS